MTARLYEATRLDFFEHVEDGRVSPLAFLVHFWIRCKARTSHRLGVAFTSAPQVASETPFSVRQVRSAMRELTRGGYIKCFRRRGAKGNYPVIVNRFEIHSGSQVLRVNASATRDWRRLKTGPVSDSVPDPKHSGSEASPTGHPYKDTTSLSHYSTTAVESSRARARAVLGFWNDLAGTGYSGEGRDAEHLIERLDEGRTVPECERVVEAAIGKWGGEAHPRKAFSHHCFGDLLALRTDPVQWRAHSGLFDETLARAAARAEIEEHQPTEV